MFTQSSPLLRRTILFGLAAIIVYALMLIGPLTEVGKISGMKPFDVRPTGYDPDTARSLLAALGEDGRALYFNRQLVLDIFYPFLVAMTLTHLYWMITPQLRNKRLATGGIILTWVATLFDYSENLGIAVMLTRWPDVSDGLVRATSSATILKSGLFTLSVFVLLGLYIWVKLGRRKTG